MDNFCTDLGAAHADIYNVIRLENKYENDIKLVKVELSSPSIGGELLENGEVIEWNYL